MTEVTRRKKGFNATDVFAFAWDYWSRQPVRFAVIMVGLTIATTVETNMPNALSNFFETLRTQKPASEIWSRLGVFLAVYFAYLLTYNFTWRLYNIFENNTFNQIYNDAFAKVESLSEQYFVNTFTGSMITTIKRGRDRMETFEDQIIVNLYPTLMTLVLTIVFLGLR